MKSNLFYLFIATTFISISLGSCANKKNCLDELTSAWVMTDYEVDKKKILKRIKESNSKMGLKESDTSLEAFIQESMKEFIRVNERIEFTPEGKFKIVIDEVDFQLADDCKSFRIQATPTKDLDISILKLNSDELILEHSDTRMEYKKAK